MSANFSALVPRTSWFHTPPCLPPLMGRASPPTLPCPALMTLSLSSPNSPCCILPYSKDALQIPPSFYARAGATFLDFSFVQWYGTPPLHDRLILASFFMKIVTLFAFQGSVYLTCRRSNPFPHALCRRIEVAFPPLHPSSFETPFPFWSPPSHLLDAPWLRFPL